MKGHRDFRGAAKQRYSVYQASAARRDLSFDLDFDLFVEVVQQNCYYCGAEPSNEQRRGKGKPPVYYSGIDRIDNSIGYTPTNIVPCCKICNGAKRTMSTEEFLGWAKQLARHQFWLYENHFYED